MLHMLYTETYACEPCLLKKNLDNNRLKHHTAISLHHRNWSGLHCQTN